VSNGNGQRFYGKYRATVINNIDPMQVGRLMLQVPDVLGPLPTSWAMPCLPLTGIQTGLFVLPSVGAGVWAEFEQGDPNYPIWVGGWWGSSAEVPALALAATPGVPNIVLQTTGQQTIVLSDMPAGLGITLKTATGAMIAVTDTGILITNGKGATIALTGPTVSVNAGALVVT
jgi:uncharacterized protein involved in type VI secretion and phage assembly